MQRVHRVQLCGPCGREGAEDHAYQRGHGDGRLAIMVEVAHFGIAHPAELAAKIGFLLMAVAWGILMAFNLITLPVEFDASRRAKAVLGQLGFIRPGQEAAAVSQVLNAAGWTYVAAFISSLAYFLWHLLPLLGGREQED